MSKENLTELEKLELEIEGLKKKKEELEEKFKEEIKAEEKRRWEEVKSAYNSYLTLYKEYVKDFEEPYNISEGNIDFYSLFKDILKEISK